MKGPLLAIAVVAAIGAAALGVFRAGPFDPGAPAPKQEDANPKNDQDEHAAQRIVLSDIKLAAAGAHLATARAAMMGGSLSFNGVLRANQETVVQVTPRFPGIVRSIRKRIGDPVNKDEQMASVESNQSLTAYDLKAPISGTVIDRQISLGEYASEQKPAFVVADLSTIWVDLYVYRQDLKRIHIGDEVSIDPDDGGDVTTGKIAYIAPVGSTETQTALARVILPNTDGSLRPGLFVTARLLLSKRAVAVAVRAGAIQTVENRTVVFVREPGDRIEARPVQVGETDQDYAEIKAGLSAGERYVAEGSFVVKAEMGKGEAQ